MATPSKPRVAEYAMPCHEHVKIVAWHGQIRPLITPHRNNMTCDTRTDDTGSPQMSVLPPAYDLAFGVTVVCPHTTPPANVSSERTPPSPHSSHCGTPHPVTHSLVPPCSDLPHCMKRFSSIPLFQTHSLCHYLSPPSPFPLPSSSFLLSLFLLSLGLVPSCTHVFSFMCLLSVILWSLFALCFMSFPFLFL